MTKKHNTDGLDSIVEDAAIASTPLTDEAATMIVPDIYEHFQRFSLQGIQSTLEVSDAWGERSVGLPTKIGETYFKTDPDGSKVSAWVSISNEDGTLSWAQLVNEDTIVPPPPFEMVYPKSLLSVTEPDVTAEKVAEHTHFVVMGPDAVIFNLPSVVGFDKEPTGAQVREGTRLYFHVGKHESGAAGEEKRSCVMSGDVEGNPIFLLEDAVDGLLPEKADRYAFSFEDESVEMVAVSYQEGDATKYGWAVIHSIQKQFRDLVENFKDLVEDLADGTAVVNPGSVGFNPQESVSSSLADVDPADVLANPVLLINTRRAKPNPDDVTDTGPVHDFETPRVVNLPNICAHNTAGGVKDKVREGSLIKVHNYGSGLAELLFGDRPPKVDGKRACNNKIMSGLASSNPMWVGPNVTVTLIPILSDTNEESYRVIEITAGA